MNAHKTLWGGGRTGGGEGVGIDFYFGKAHVLFFSQMNPKIGVRGPELVSWAQIGMNQQPTYMGQYLMLLPW